MTTDTHQGTVLVVDDQRSAVDMMTRLFENNGYQVRAAYSGEEAIESVNEQRPDIILLDIMMPGISGYDVLDQLKSTPKSADIPIIFITAKDTAKDVEQALESGADDYIAKPVKPRELVARVKSKLEAHRLRETIQQRTTDLEILLRVGEELNTNLNVDQLLDLTLYLLLDLMPCYAAVICHADEDRHISESRISEKGKSPEKIDVNEELLTLLLDDRNGAPYYWTSSDDAVLFDAPYGLMMGLWHGETFHGALITLSKTAYNNHQIRLYEGIARQVTSALRNAELYQVKVNYANHLEDMVEERTQELRSAQELLIRSEKLASVGRLAAGIAHEINNPLQPITINLELALEDVDSGNDIHPEDIRESLKSAKRIRRIVDRLLQFTRRRGEEAPDMETLQLVDVINDVIKLSRTFIRQSGINITTDIPEALCIHGNRDQLEQVFLNMILNAKAAMAEGGELTINAHETDGVIYLDFQDDGHGIPADMQDKIFEPFVSTREEGTGLGLFVSYEIIQNHNGDIYVDSKEGEGTTFTITFPAVAVEETR